MVLLEKLRYQWNRLFHFQISPFGSEYQEAWNHRYELFSRFDEGIQTDAIGLYSVTPEKIAVQIAEQTAMNKSISSIVDAFCGIGGNAIAFAKNFSTVYAIDIDRERLNMARHNAELYARSIKFMEGDFLTVASTLATDAVFLDPPWGGPSYIEKDPFRLADFSPDGHELLAAAFQYYRYVILRVPANFAMDELEAFNHPFQTQDNVLNGRLLSVTIYFF